jgi:glutaminase
MDVQAVLEKIYKKVKKMKITGKNADYIPQLKKVNPNIFAISIFTVDGQEYNVGDCSKEVAIESASKVFSLALALKTVGTSGVSKLIGTQQTYSEFNSIGAIETSPNHTVNSFENGGAMATTSIYYEENSTKYDKKIFDNMSEFAGRKLTYSVPTYQSEINNLDHNLAIAYLLKSYGRFYGEVIPTILAYTKQCSAMVTSKDVAVMAATIANYGVNPKTHKKVIDKKMVPYIINHMATNGMYGYSETWMTNIGMPAKSGVGGVVLIVVPNVMGIGIISPPLDKIGNSAKGIIAAQEIADALHLGIFDYREKVKF